MLMALVSLCVSAGDAGLYFQIEGLEGSIPCPVIFAPKGSLFLLGATALENFGVDVNPIQKKVKPILAIIGGFLASQ